MMQSGTSSLPSATALARHADDLYKVVEQDAPAPDFDQVKDSWLRSAGEHGLDAETAEAPRILTSREIGEEREPCIDVIHSAEDELDRLYGVVRHAGYAILFCNTGGVVIDHRGEENDAGAFKFWGVWRGGVWSEAVEGTNGIGTCIAEERLVTVHRGQHYRSRHIDLSCSGAPVFGVDGRLTAVLDVSAIDPDKSEQAHALTGPLTAAAALAVEERFFRESFRAEWIIAAAPPEEPSEPMLLAVDGGKRVVGANRAARALLRIDDQKLRAGVALWSLFEHEGGLFRRRDAGDIPTLLVAADSGESWPALVTSPETPQNTWQSARTPSLHTRPRSDQLAGLKLLRSVAPMRGGVPPLAMRRLQDYIDAHIDERIELPDLAAVAGLSIYHFARQFKETTGATPHRYLVQKRLQRARDMLTRSALSLSEIAWAAGFSDQSHFTRLFGQNFGVTPGQFRRLQN
jgi:transcriptional regulator of acetoin/glycerol metabolism/AraC-like DNA-binding protein